MKNEAVLIVGLLIAGFLIWTVLAFVGLASGYRKGKGPLLSPLRAIKRIPGVLILPALALLGAGGYLVYLEIRAMAAMSGIIGPLFALGIVCGIGGATLLSAQCFLRKN